MPPLCVNVWLNGVPATPLETAGLVTVMVWQVMVSVYSAPVPVQPFASVALTVMENVPVWVGVPDSVPLEARVRPAGSVPLASENVVVPTPPLSVKVWLNGAAATPLVTAGLVTMMFGQVICRLYVGLMPVQPCESVTRTVMGKLPTTVGVPERTPLVESVRPAGSEPLASENVAVPMAPVCVKVWLKGTPAGPLVTDGLVMVMMLQQIGRAGSPTGSDGAAGEQLPVVMVGKTPTEGPLVGKVVPEVETVPQAVRAMVPCAATPEAPAPTGRTSPTPRTQLTLPECERAVMCPPAASLSNLVKSPTAESVPWSRVTVPLLETSIEPPVL